MPESTAPEKLKKPYNPEETEDRLYRAWQESGLFSPEGCIQAGITTPDAPVFSIVLPPPNVTGTLHMGHAAMLVIEDIMVRHARMKGMRTLWLPGTDHAAIATQSKVEKELLKKEALSRHDLGREKFLERVRAFARSSHDTIVGQVKKMGASIDWGREAFTLDEKRTRAVYTAFKRMYDDGLIYRGHRIVNWDPKGQTTISDDEVEYKEEKTKLYTFKYSRDFPIAISTTRPETKLGDTAVAVHPSDERYTTYVGKTYRVDFCGEHLEIQIVADEAVDPAFGTGAVGVTPAHSQTDWEIAERHGLPLKQIINEYGKITVGGEDVKDKKVREAREAVVSWVRAHDLLIEETEVVHNVATAERTGGVIEPLPKLQWFVAVNKRFAVPRFKMLGKFLHKKTTLKEIMKKAVSSGKIKILPERFEKVYYHWIDNLRDWCISRQIWYGHQIPVWYRDEEIYCGVEAPPGDRWIQDEDTLDTWFSSGLWTFSTLGWPEDTKDLRTYHPTSVLETGYDILFFWVARMILMSGYLLGDVPFRTIYLHGLVRDAKGRKMSKSLDNIIDPLDLIKKYGADATRLSLIIGSAPGNDLKLSEDKVRGYKHYANKLWNITRFTLENAENITPAPLTETDGNIWKEFEKFTVDYNKEMDQFHYSLAGEKLYHYLWHTLADKILEESKPIFREGSPEARASRRYLLRAILENSIKLLHPFMPFVTEELWQTIYPNKGFLMGAQWPEKAALPKT